MTLIICVKTYVKLGLLKEIGVVTLVCLIYVPDVNTLLKFFYIVTFFFFCFSGYLATKTKEVIYLKDPPLFDPTRPTRRNPY